MSRLAIEAGALILLVVAFFVYRQHLISVGEDRIRQADSIARAQVEGENRLKEAQAKQAVAEGAKTYVEKITAPVANPVAVRLCKRADDHRTVPQASATRPSADAAAALRGEPAENTQTRPDIGPDLIANARDADALVTALHSYVNEVCLR